MDTTTTQKYIKNKKINKKLFDGKNGKGKKKGKIISTVSHQGVSFTHPKSPK